MSNVPPNGNQGGYEGYNEFAGAPIPPQVPNFPGQQVFPGVISGVGLQRPKVGLTDSVKLFFKNYATFYGRASRTKYWYVVLAYVLLNIVFGALTGLFGIQTSDSGSIDSIQYTAFGNALFVIQGLIAIATIIPSIAISVRRLHDAAFSGWLILLHLIPFAGSLIVLILHILPSKPEGVRYDNPDGSQPATS